MRCEESEDNMTYLLGKFSHLGKSAKSLRSAVIAAALFAIAAPLARTQAGVFPPDLPPPPGPLNLVPVPMPDLSQFVVDKKTAIALGKALFWDQQAGSDGLACASCHFHAGADNRVQNQLDPGLRNTNPALQNVWNLTASNRNSKTGPPPGGGPNYTLEKLDFPLHQLMDPTNRNSKVVFDSNDVVGSQGVFRADFNHINVLRDNDPKKIEVCTSALSPTFSVHGINTRQVEPRNTPTVINAIFNFRNFWDGRANNIFNGRDPFGPRDLTAGSDPLNSVLTADALGRLTPMKVAIADASLASQAVGPPGSDLEMSCRGRVFEEIGQKLLQLRPLGLQSVDPTDSVLGAYVPKSASNNGANDNTATGGTGLNASYEALIRKAFAPQFWNSTRLTADGYRQIEKNFSFFWGLSIMLYESTLVSDRAPFDQYMNGNISAMTTQQVTGLQVFVGKAGCVFCHKGAEFTGAATSLRTLRDMGGQVEHMIMGDGTVSLYDSGFYNIGVRPTTEDIGVGGTDTWGNPLSWSRQAKNAVAAGKAVTTMLAIGPDAINVATCNFQIDPCLPVTNNARDSVDGSFKVPSLRNVELTGPYFHNGGQATLEQVVDFYSRGGDGAGTDFANTTGFGVNPTNRAPAILPLNLSAADKANLVAFLKTLTDERVRWEQAPFDHPSLTVPNGHPIDETHVLKDPLTVYALSEFEFIPAVGAAGRLAKKLPALAAFDAGLK
jgi:cytochrome c peroxidase